MVEQCACVCVLVVVVVVHLEHHFFRHLTLFYYSPKGYLECLYMFLVFYIINEYDQESR